MTVEEENIFYKIEFINLMAKMALKFILKANSLEECQKIAVDTLNKITKKEEKTQ